ncbi:hypothetical protein JMJ35_008950 [Cladonia borealis]|uniref:Cyclin-D1-binding protein 1-like N-terminal domain-containing protein n=1 Tax=Cladonia borealis TaxID=184061 RepID=A0AA39QUP1_9LECA|nr:hypothetical protein JMJ35_008950 [Cladonia borealis]
MAPSKEPGNLATLRNALSSTKALIRSFQAALQSPTPPPSVIQDPPNPLALLSDASQILKAQTTKLSLLILNKPFTHSAITFILKSLSNNCLPGLISALEICPATKYTRLLHQHIRSTLLKVMRELLSLIASIPSDEHGIETSTGRNTLASTGVLWAECDKMVELASKGLVYLATQRTEDHHGLLKDAIQELEEWDPDEDTDSDTDSLSSNKQKPASTPTADNISSAIEELHISSIANLRKSTLLTLRTVRVIYPALKKRRISTFPNITSASTLESLPTSADIDALDSLVDQAKGFTDAADEIAGALYEGDVEQVERRLRALRESAEGCAIGVKTGWKGEEDEFTAWAEKWTARLEEVGRE